MPQVEFELSTGESVTLGHITLTIMDVDDGIVAVRVDNEMTGESTLGELQLLTPPPPTSLLSHFYN